MLAELREGNCYMNMPYRPAKKADSHRRSTRSRRVELSLMDLP
jgi:hypothetical protein